MSTIFGMIQEYNFSAANKKRSVNEQFAALIQDMPNVISLFQMGSLSNGAITGNMKYEWLDQVLTQYTTTIDTGGGGTGTTLTLASTAGIKVGDYLAFEAADGAYISEQVKVTAISGNDLTVVREASPVNLADGTTVKILPSTIDGAGLSDMTDGTYDEPTTSFNYMENYSRLYRITKQAAATGLYGMTPDTIEQKIAELGLQNMQQIMRQMNQNCIYGKRSAAPSSTVTGKSGGLIDFISGGPTHDATGGAISLAKINDVVASMKSAGSVTPVYTAVMSSDQARKISALQTVANTQILNIPQGSQQAGTLVTSILNDLPNAITNVFIDDNIAKDQIFILDPAMLSIVPLIDIEDNAANSADAEQFIARAITATVTFEIKNAQQAHGLLTGLTI